ncbi:MAG TPA: DUF3048 domain-containing protein [Anaerolineae bacterium]
MHRAIRRPPALSIAAMAVLALSACAGPDSSPISVAPIASLSASAVTESASALLATPTASPAPPTETPAAPPTPAFDPNTCPLTGLPVQGIDWSQRRAILVQIGNSPPERPQSELALADVVFEHLAEGGITRFSAAYLCHAAQDIGPVRSGRLINLENVPMLNAIFALSGASDGVMARLSASEVTQTWLISDGGDPGFRRLEARNPPFNLYTSTEAIWSAASERGWIPGARMTVLPFGDAPSGGSPATQIDLPIRPGITDVAYTYDTATGLYLRSMGGFPHTDASTGQPLSAANVLVIYAPHAETDIIEDSLGSRSVQIDLSSGGRAQLARDGQVYEGTWSRPDVHTFFDLKDASGQAMRLRPGVTWIQVVPVEFGGVVR